MINIFIIIGDKMETKQIDEFKVVGIEIETTVETCKDVMGKLWGDFLAKMSDIKNITGDKMYGVCTTTGECSFKYVAGIKVSEFEDVPGGMVSQTVAVDKFLEFKHVGTAQNMGETYNRIMEKDLPESTFKEKKIWIEEYGKDYNPESETAEMKIMVAVEEK